MKINVGKSDRILRIVTGIAIIAGGAFMGSWWGLVGVVPLATGVIRWCPAYLPLGINTCETENHSAGNQT